MLCVVVIVVCLSLNLVRDQYGLGSSLFYSVSEPYITNCYSFLLGNLSYLLSTIYLVVGTVSFILSYSLFTTSDMNF